MSTESVMSSNHLIFCHPLLLLPSIFPSIRGFLNESDLPIRWPKCWTFSFSISPSKEYSGLISFRIDSGLISFRIDWLDLLAVQGTLKSLLQWHVSKASILSCSHQGSLVCYSPWGRKESDTAEWPPLWSTLISIHDYWKNLSFDYADLCWQSNVSVFLICCLGWS